VPVVSELNRRIAPYVVRDRAPENVFLARQPWRWRQLVNAHEIERDSRTGINRCGTPSGS
jgi:hypothetical protein